MSTAARKPRGNSCCPQQRVELAGALQRIKIVATSDMPLADEDLWHRVAAAGLFFHLKSGFSVHEDIDLLERRTLLLQERLGAHAIGTDRRRVDGDFRH